MKKILLYIMVLFVHRVYTLEKNVCVDCHKEIEEESLKNPVLEWKKSIHAENGISCHNCHGGNPRDEEVAMDPEFGFVGIPEDSEIPDFCGKCHQGVRENYLKSEHGALEEGPTCVTCHTAHSQKRAGLYLINPDLCATCHTYERAEKIKFALMNTENEIKNLEKRIDNLWVNGMDVEMLKKMWFATKNSFGRLTHVVNVDYILQQTGGIYADLAKIEKEIEGKEDVLKKRKIVGIAVVIFFLISAFMFDRFYKILKKE